MPSSAAEDDLAALRVALWDELQRAARDKSHGWRTPVLATRDGEGADARTVVLREVDAERRQVLIYTDVRSPKVAQLQAHPQATLVAWCPSLGWQLRLKARLSLDTDGLALSSRWARLQLSPAAQDYLSPLPPGSALDTAPVPARDTRGHFALIRAEVEAIDWLGLRPGGHRRAVFDAAGARWVTP